MYADKLKLSVDVVGDSANWEIKNTDSAATQSQSFQVAGLGNQKMYFHLIVFLKGEYSEVDLNSINVPFSIFGVNAA